MLANNPGVPKPREKKMRKTNKGSEEVVEPEVAVEDLEPRNADRFDFTFNELFYSLNIEIDDYGERIGSKSDELGRIVTKDGISREEETFYEADELDENGNPLPRDQPLIPLSDLKCVQYF